MLVKLVRMLTMRVRVKYMLLMEAVTHSGWLKTATNHVLSVTSKAVVTTLVWKIVISGHQRGSVMMLMMSGCG
jgi:hypothetical protein